LAFGLLAQDALAQALRREQSDAVFRARVEWWRTQLLPLVDEGAQEPPARVWTEIARALPQNDNNQAGLRRWRAAAVAASTLAAGLLAVIVLHPAPTPEAPRVVVAALRGASGASATIAYETNTGSLTIAPSDIDAKGRDAELWIIPADGTPRSLGVIDWQRASAPHVAVNKRALILPGTNFAISLEPKGGSRTGLPTGPVIASGKISGA